MSRSQTLKERFWSRVRKTSGCWLWEGASGGAGHGRIWLNGKFVQATHVSLLLAGNPLPEGMWALHRCDNPPCVRPSHLFAGTHSDNIRDAIKKGLKTLRGEKNPLAKFTCQQILSIRKRHAAGERQVALANEANVTQAAISAIVLRKTWTHI